MKVLLINAVCGTGSTGHIVADIWKALKDQGHEAKVAYGVGQGRIVDPEDQICFNNKVGYYTHNLLAKLTDKTGMYSKRQTKALLKKIDEFQPDIIHLHNLHGYYINYPILFEYLAKKDIPVVWTLHDCWAYTGHCAHFSYIQCSKWTNMCSSCPQKRVYPKSFFVDRSEKNYEAKKKYFCKVSNMTIVTPSDWLASMVRLSFLKQYEVKVIPNGIDTNRFKARKSSFKTKHQIESKEMVLAVANVWNQKKGFDDVIKISEKLNPIDYQVVMVGVTKEQIHTLPKTVLPIMRTASVDELVEIYSAADVFINPSYEETMGMVTVEALACGVPCFVYDKTAVPEVVDAKSGMIFQAGDIESICKAITNREYMKLTEMRQRAVLFDKKKEYKKYLDLYDSVIQNRQDIE